MDAELFRGDISKIMLQKKLAENMVLNFLLQMQQLFSADISKITLHKNYSIKTLVENCSWKL